MAPKIVDNIKECGFPSAIRTNQTGNTTVPYRQGNAVNGMNTAKTHVQVFDPYHKPNKLWGTEVAVPHK